MVLSEDKSSTIGALEGTLREFGAGQVRIFAFFGKAEVMDAVGDNGKVEFQVVGKLKTGRYFYGTDSIKVIERQNDDNDEE